MGTNLDILAIGNCYLEKKKQDKKNKIIASFPGTDVQKLSPGINKNK